MNREQMIEVAYEAANQGFMDRHESKRPVDRRRVELAVDAILVLPDPELEAQLARNDARRLDAAEAELARLREDHEAVKRELSSATQFGLDEYKRAKKAEAVVEAAREVAASDEGEPGFERLLRRLDLALAALDGGKPR